MNEKPEWKDAPEWAQWMAQDEPGDHRDHYWVWFERKPSKMSNGWIDRTPDGRWLQTDVVAKQEQWKQTLEERPK
ncbi:hypothetical protein D3C75_996080 [compost metagenome]